MSMSKKNNVSRLTHSEGDKTADAIFGTVEISVCEDYFYTFKSYRVGLLNRAIAKE